MHLRNILLQKLLPVSLYDHLINDDLLVAILALQLHLDIFIMYLVENGLVFFEEEEVFDLIKEYILSIDFIFN